LARELDDPLETPELVEPPIVLDRLDEDVPPEPPTPLDADAPPALVLPLD
jgi:hypothetical protein